MRADNWLPCRNSDTKSMRMSDIDKGAQSPADIAAAEGYFWGDQVSEVYFKPAEQA